MSQGSSTTGDFQPIAFVRRYLDALEQGMTGDALAMFFTPDVVQREFPNRLVPQGATRDLEAILLASERGKNVVSAQRYEILHAVVDGERAAVEVQWSAQLAVPVATLPVGGEMRARFAIFILFREGKIAEQNNYDCFDPW